MHTCLFYTEQYQSCIIELLDYFSTGISLVSAWV